jgi:DNA invertase Pin-like site-specific DNA recombinase
MTARGEAITEITPAVAYAAKSTEDKHGSIPTQLADCRKLAETWTQLAERDETKVGLEVVAEFSDEAQSAYHGDRGPGLAAALAECERLAAEHATCALIVQHSDRLARGDAKQAKALVEYALWGIKASVTIHSVQDAEMFSDGDYGLLMSTIGGMRNHQDSKRKSLSVKDGLKRRAEKGKVAGGWRIYGYRRFYELDGRGKAVSHLEIVKAEAEIIILIFKESCDGVSQRAIARRLTEKGIPTVKGGPWEQATIGKILKNPIYKGFVRHGTDLVKGDHPTIVEPQLWDRAEAIRKTAVRRTGGRSPNGDHLLTRGLLRCGQCGSAMVPITVKGPRMPHLDHYQCGRRKGHGAKGCDQSSIRRSVVDDALLEDLLASFIDLDETRRRIESRTVADLTIAREALAQAEGELLRTQEAMVRIEKDYKADKITADQWSRLEASLTNDLPGAREALQQAQEHVEKVEIAGGLADGEEVLLRHLGTLKAAVADGVERAPDLPALRTVLRDLFERIELIRWPGFGTGGTEDSIAWPESPTVKQGEVSYALLPHVRHEALDSGLAVKKAVLPVGKPDTTPSCSSSSRRGSRSSRPCCPATTPPSPTTSA